MATIVKPNTFSAGATIVAAEHNDNFDTIYDEFNGNIDNDNIKASAGIVDTKLATISTAGKINPTAISNHVKADYFHWFSQSAGNLTVTGTGFTAKGVTLLSFANGKQQFSIGFGDGTRYRCAYFSTAGNGTWNATSGSVSCLYFDASNVISASTTNFNSDGFVIAWGKTGTPPNNTITNYYLAIA